MSVQSIISDLQKQNIRLWIESDKLRCSAPVGVLTSEIREELKRNKIEIMRFLRMAQSIVDQQTAIVPMQSKGERIPILGVGGHNGDVFTYRVFVQHLEADQPFYGLQPPGLDGVAVPLQSVPELATYFKSQIIEAFGNTPLIIAGYCAGGTIAFELANQLQKCGSTVTLLALFGTPYPSALRFMAFKQVERRIMARARIIAGLPSLRERTRHILELGKTICDRIRTTEISSSPDSVMMFRSKVEQITIAAVRRYVPAPYSGNVALFLPNRKWICNGDYPLRWQSKAPHCQIYFGPDECSHDGMLRPPDVTSIAELFKRSRDSCSTGASEATLSGC